MDFILDRDLDIIRRAFPQVNSEQTRVEFLPLDTYEWRVAFAETIKRGKRTYESKKGLQARLWRIAGAIFDNSEWTKRGQEKRIAPAPYREERIEIKRWHYSLGGIYHIDARIGYLPETDTLFIAHWKQGGIF